MREPKTDDDVYAMDQCRCLAYGAYMKNSHTHVHTCRLAQQDTCTSTHLHIYIHVHVHIHVYIQYVHEELSVNTL